MRRCVVTRERMAKEHLIRFVVGPDNTIVPDLAERLPGRGIWLSARRDVLESGSSVPGSGKAAARLAGCFARAARGQVQVPPNLAHVLQQALARRVADTLGLARRAGQAVAGFAKAGDWVRAGRVGLIVQASDGSAEERRRFVSSETAARLGVAVVTPLDRAALGAVFGRDHVVHVAIAPGRLAEAVRIEATRLAGVSRVAGQDTDDRAAARPSSVDG